MTEPLIAYCVKCREKREMANSQPEYTAAGTPGIRGKCAQCETTMFKMGRTDAHVGLPKPDPKPRAKLKPKKTKSKAKKPRTPRGKLVIVESPAKAKTIGKFLGPKYKVKASVGHVRDLLRSQLSVDPENNFTPKYRVPNEKRNLVKELKQDVTQAAEIYLAMDADREGEAIAWHLIEATEVDPSQVRRVVFHEITPDAIAQAFKSTREIDLNRVNAQQARRILDRLVGYKISPLLWRRVRNRTSAGRVQSVALRLICERETEIDEFISIEYWSLMVKLAQSSATEAVNGTERQSFIARVLTMNGKNLDLHSEAETLAVIDILQVSPITVTNIKRGQRRRKPAPPFITSTLQQEASRRLGFNTKKTMRIAQQLYEGVELADGETVGLITYMRTDSTHVATQAQQETRDLITERYGSDFLPEKPPEYKTKARAAQEAHEAIRPSSVWRVPSQVKDFLTRDQNRLYNLIWSRFVASQMTNALYETLRVDMKADRVDKKAGQGDKDTDTCGLRASGSKLKFPGFLSVYEESKDEDATVDEEADINIPDLAKDEALDLIDVLPDQHFTQPPPRYTEASLVKSLEELGIGRPSTYAPIISTIQERGYVEREDKRLFPTEIGQIVNDLLITYFPDVVDLEFTARMEASLDKIAWGDCDWVPVLDEFYTPFEQAIQAAEENMPKIELSSLKIGEDCPECGHDLIVKYGRFGKFIACDNFPDCRYTRPFMQKIGVSCPECRQELVERKTKKGRTFYGCSTYPECEWTSWKRPLPTPCPECEGLLVVQNKHSAQCTLCDSRFNLDDLPQPPQPSHEPDKAAVSEQP